MASVVTTTAWQGATDQVEAVEAQLNLPVHREQWKYTRNSKVRALIEALPQQASAETSSNSLSAAELTSLAPLASLTLHQVASLGVIQVSGGILDMDEIDSSHGTGIVIEIADHAEVVINEVKLHTNCQLRWLKLGEGAKVTHNRNLFTDSQQWHYLHVDVPASAQYHLHNHSMGTDLHRQDIQIDLTGPGAEVTLQAAAVVARNAHLDQQLRLQHKAPNTTSEQRINAIALQAAKVTFGGRIHIHADCDGTDAQLNNRNLSLEPGAVINTKPELEIYSEDVSCAHGATVGQISDAHRFYCLSRGIDPVLTEILLSRGFISETTDGELAEDALAAFNQAIGQAAT